MQNKTVLWPEDWRDYELIDSGEGAKLERWGAYILSRPDPRAIWKRTNPALWEKTEAKYENDHWTFKTPPPTEWKISYQDIKFNLKPTDFKHTGVFPEQATNWNWIEKKVRNATNNSRQLEVLNLFAYTGGATMAAAMAGAHVTHVDASRPAMMWASENVKLTKIHKDKVRWIQDDALKFVQREFRRGMRYDAIIMDPPRFGRGANGEIWKLEENLSELVWECKKILTDNPVFYLLNAYTSDLSCLALGNLLTDVMGSGVEWGELTLKQSGNDRLLPAGVFVRWSN